MMLNNRNMPSLFLGMMIKHADRSNRRGKRFILASRLQSIVPWKPKSLRGSHHSHIRKGEEMPDAQLPLNFPSSQGSAHEITLPTFRVGCLSAINPFLRLLCRHAHRPASPTQLLTDFTDDSGPCHVDKTNCHSVILGKPPRFMSSKRNSSCCSVPSLPNWTRFSRLNRVPLYSLDWLELAV